MTFRKTKVTLYLFAFGLATGLAFILVCASKSEIAGPNQILETLNGVEVDYASQIYDHNHMAIGSIYKDRRFYKNIESIPNHVQLAFLAAEDKNFFHHFGVDLLAIIRALWQNLRHGVVQQGASTITQQVVRNTFLTPERTLLRKLKEMLIALMLERRMTKKQILERYLNSVYFSRNCYGIEAAALSFFGKHAQDLTLAEATLLAVSVRAPSALALDRHFDRARKRQIILLSQMKDEGVISEVEASTAIDEDVSIVSGQNTGRDGYFIDFALLEMSRKLARSDVRSASYQIVTSLDSSLQEKLTKLTRAFASRYLDPYVTDTLDHLEASFYAVDVKSSMIVAMAGGLSYKKSQFNRATHTLRSNSVLAYPLYAGFALDNGFDLLSTLESGNQKMSLFESLMVQDEQSFDHLALLLGQVKLKNFANKIGLFFKPPFGATSYSLAQIVSAYATLLKHGGSSPFDSILEIKDKGGKSLFRRGMPARQATLSAKSRYLIGDTLHQTLFHLPRPLMRGAFGYYAISKGQKDIYAIVGTENLVCGMWFGGEKGRLRLGKNRDAAQFLVKELQKRLYGVLDTYQSLDPEPDLFSRTKLYGTRHAWLDGSFVPFDPGRETF